MAYYLRDQLLALWPEVEIVHLARDGVDAAARIAELAPDHAVLDIQMPGLTGLEVAQRIEGSTRVVFFTAYDEFAIRAFELAALDYVLKPVSTERLACTVARLRVPSGPATAQALHPLTCSPSRPRLRYILASHGGRTHHLDVTSVRFFQADDKYTVVASVHW
ncbi:LytR/AlgR family response regulator transcription factor [Janthinobacterium sp. ROICE36]|uniref:LytR/AlgR family response regulator transcription factor n=1 Tax=Janthinobacterium sp. ROICE36 TaxID=2048670 RepID=UPI0021558A02|nr:response regulator [Janthinobacterium sp. ROICE36]